MEGLLPSCHGGRSTVQQRCWAVAVVSAASEVSRIKNLRYSSKKQKNSLAFPINRYHNAHPSWGFSNEPNSKAVVAPALPRTYWA